MKRVVEAIVGICAEVAGIGPTKLGVLPRYLIALLLIGVGTLVRLAIAPQEAGLPYVTYFPAATLAAIVGGIGPGILATVAGAVTAAYLFIPPFAAIKFDTEAVASALVFCLDELIVCSAIEAMRRYHVRYVHSAAALAEAHGAEHEARVDAERANRAKSRFLAAASHDLRQPYQALRLFLAALQNPRLDDERRRQVLANMEKAMAAGEELLQSLLDISTLDAGVVAPKTAQISANDFVAALAVRHRPVAEAKGLRFRVHAPDGRFESDPVLLARILDNLLTNAVRYTERGGVLVACRIASGHPVFEVWDTGIGIPPEHRKAVFEEFYQIANDERDRSKGVGLGLAVVSRTAKLLGAALTMQSTVGKGTRFRVALPARVHPQSLAPATGPEAVS